MKSKELMIGDWHWWEAEGKKYPMQVTRKDYALYDEDIANFEPIPLTPEILEKNGFVKEEFKESPYVDWYKLVYSAYPNKEAELVEVNIVKENNEIVGIACAKMMHTNQRLFRIEKYREMNIYVHELQHALRLSGIEKEIIL